jgi:hypothetical protein
MRTHVYVDGFNLYYGPSKGHRMHAAKSMQADAAAIVDAALQDAVNKRTKK